MMDWCWISIHFLYGVIMIMTALACIDIYLWLSMNAKDKHRTLFPCQSLYLWIKRRKER